MMTTATASYNAGKFTVYAEVHACAAKIFAAVTT
jgi:hypothetical protein